MAAFIVPITILTIWFILAVISELMDASKKNALRLEQKRRNKLKREREREIKRQRI